MVLFLFLFKPPIPIGAGRVLRRPIRRGGKGRSRKRWKLLASGKHAPSTQDPLSPPHRQSGRQLRQAAGREERRQEGQEEMELQLMGLIGLIGHKAQLWQLWHSMEEGATNRDAISHTIASR